MTRSPADELGALRSEARGLRRKVAAAQAEVVVLRYGRAAGAAQALAEADALEARAGAREERAAELEEREAVRLAIIAPGEELGPRHLHALPPRAPRGSGELVRAPIDRE